MVSVIGMSRFQDDVKNTVNVLTSRRRVLFRSICKVHMGQRLRRFLQSRQGGQECLEGSTIVSIIGEQDLFVRIFSGGFPMMSPHETL